MTAQIKVKVRRKAIVKLKQQVKFPANVIANNFITVTRANGTYTFDVNYSVLTPGPITDPTTAYIAILDQTAGIYKEVALSSLLTSGLDADLQAIAALTGTGILSRTADGIWALRTLQAPAAGITITNPGGVAGNETFALANDLAALEGLGSTGIAARTAADTWAQRTITGTASRLTVTNGDGVAGNPTLDISTSYVGQATITTLGTITTGVWTGTDVAFANIAQGTARSVLGVTGNATADLASVQGSAGQILGVPNAGTSLAFTATPQLGVSGTLGSLTFGNATSGLVTLQPVTGALGTVTVSLPAATDTLVGKATTDILTNKTISGASNTLSAIALSSLATQSAFTFVGNNTSGAASPTAVSIASLTSKASPVAADLVMIADSAASNAWKQTTVSALASAGSVASINGQTGAIAIRLMPGGRITLTTNTPVMSATAAAQTTIYYTPYLHNSIELYDGANWVPATFAQISQLTTDATKSPAAVATGNVYDLFVWNDAGTIRCTRGPAWSSTTSRGTGAGTSELTTVEGIKLNANSITNGPAAQRGRYVGTVYSDQSNAVSYILGASSVAGMLGVWNMHNRVFVATTATDATATWTYSTATYRSANNNTANRVTWVSGLAEESSSAVHQFAISLAVNGALARAGVALDATNTADKQGTYLATANATGVLSSIAKNNYAPQLGLHFIQATEIGDGTNTATFNGGANQGLSFETRM
jgi:hypothetical protein